MRIRTVTLAAPVTVVLVFVAAFAVSRPYFGDRQAQLTVGSGADPESLNPVVATTTTAAFIQYFLFDTLLQLDENAQPVPHLARGYELNQTSRLYFPTPREAAAAGEAIGSHRDAWAEAGLRQLTAEGDCVTLDLARAGAGYQDVVFRWIGRVEPVKVQRWQAAINPRIQWKDKPPAEPVTTDTFLAWVQKTQPGGAAQPRVLYAWKNTSSTFEVYTVGADGAFLEDIQRLFAEAIGAGVTGAEPAPAAANSASKQSAPAVAAPEDRAGDGARRMEVTLAGPLQIQFDKDWPAQDEPLMIFHLHEGVKWHDGVPFSSADVKFTYEAFMNEKNASPRRSDFELIKDVDTPDEHTVRVRYKEPFSPCLYTWAYYEIIPRHVLAAEPDLRHLTHSNFNRAPIGTGAYKLKAWATNQYIVLERNDAYWRGRPHLPRIAYRIIPDAAVSQMEFERGGFDYDGLEPHQVARFEKDPRYQIFRGPSNSYSYIGWNLKNPFFADRRVRTALAHAIDVSAIIKYVMYGNGTPCNGPFVPVTPWWNPDVKPISYDPAKAKRLLADAGWKPGPDGILVNTEGTRFHFTLITNNASPIRKDIAVLAQQYLRQIGIEVEVIEYEWAVFIKNYIDARNFDACVLGWSLGFDQDLYQIFHGSQANRPQSLNFVSYVNPEVDQLIEKARTEFDLAKIEECTHKVSRLIYEDQPYLFLFYPESIAAMPKGLYHVKRPGPDGAWIDEPIRRTKLGFTIYQKWWAQGPAAKMEQ